MDYWITAMALFVVSSLLGGLNYITTILNMRTKGMSMTRLPLTIWALFFTRAFGPGLASRIDRLAVARVPHEAGRGWLARYAAMVTSAHTGAVLAVPETRVVAQPLVKPPHLGDFAHVERGAQ